LKFDLHRKPALLAIAAAVIALPAGAYIVGTLNGTDPAPQVSSSASAATPPAIPALVVEPKPPSPLVHTVEIENGDNLMDVLVKAGAERADAYTAIQS
jgi:hypothetical protein